MQLGRKIRDLRLRRGLTVQQLADASGLSKGFISQVENDRTSPSLATLRDLATALRTSVAYLVVEDDPTLHVVRAAERPRIRVRRQHLAASRCSPPSRSATSSCSCSSCRPGRRPTATSATPTTARSACCASRDACACVHGEQELVLETGDSCHFDGRVAALDREPGRRAGAGARGDDAGGLRAGAAGWTSPGPSRRSGPWRRRPPDSPCVPRRARLGCDTAPHRTPHLRRDP